MNNIRFVTKKIELTEDQKAHIERHFAKFEKMLKEPYSISCTVEKKPNNKFKLELTINERKLYRIETYADTIENAVDDVENRMFRTLRKAKEKKESRTHRSLRHENEQSTESIPSVVAKVKRFPIKPCSVEEAIEAMIDTDHDFYVFYNEETNSNDVVYERKDGSIGLIQLI